MKIIDTHIHLFEKPYSDLFDNSHIKSGEDGELHLFEEYQRKYGVEAAFVVCYEEGHCPRNNRYVESLMGARKWLYSFGYVRPDAAAFQDAAHNVIANRHFGISCYLGKTECGEWLNDSSLEALWGELQEKNIPVSLTILPQQCVELRKLLKKAGRLTVLVNHMGRPRLTNGKLDLDNYQCVAALSEFENVHVKLSGSYAFSNEGWRCPQTDLFCVIDLLKRDFSAKKLMFASDFSPVLEFNTYRQALELLRMDYRGFSESELDDVYYSNAQRLIERRTA